MLDEIEHVAFEESYVLGWASAGGGSINIFLQLLLTNGHSQFRTFDEENEYGCYRLAVLTVDDVLNQSGLEPCEVIPVWDDVLKEYKDVDEINAVRMDSREVRLSCDLRTIAVECMSSSLEIVGESGQGAFSKWLT